MLGAAFIEYSIKLILFSAVAISGVAVGIKLRKRKDRKEELKGNK